jgi:hypothetical protein
VSATATVRRSTRSPATEPGRALLDALAFYQQDPVAYVEDIILRRVSDRPRSETIEPQQADVLELLPQHDRIAVAAANGVGKDTVTAWIIEWYLVCHHKARIPVVSPTGRQVKRTIFAEVAAWTPQSLAAPKLELLLTNELRHRSAPQEWWALGFAPTVREDDPTGGIEGIHAESLLFVITEAKAVPQGVWDAAQRMCTRPGNKLFAQSVPGPEAGDFFKCFTIKARTWKTITFPAARWNDPAKRYESTTRLVSQASIDEKRADGEDAPNFQAGVLARFLRQGSEHLIPLADVIAAESAARHAALSDTAPVEMGLDVARYGDDSSVAATRHGDRVLPLETISDLDTMTLTGWTLERVRARRPTVLRVDAIGIGAGVYDRLRELQAERTVNDAGQERPKYPELDGVRLVGVNVAEKPSDDTRWVNLRDELWDLLRARLQAGRLALPEEPTLREELVTVKYAFTSAGQKKIEPKANHKARLGRSPDKADAVCLAFGGSQVAAVSERVDPTTDTYHARPAAPSVWGRRR